jgi:hypothetical protein
MRTTQKRLPRRDVLRPSSVWVFVAIALAWTIVFLLPDWRDARLRHAARLAGYVAFVAMLVPYLHVIRRMFRYRHGRAMTFWLRLHIVAAYVAFAGVLVHCQGRASTTLTLLLVWLTWIVMVSGVVGFYGQKLLYLLMPRMVPDEVGLERLEPERQQLLKTAEELMKKKEMQGMPEVIQRFCDAALHKSLPAPLSLRDWLLGRQTGDEALSENWYQRAASFADEKQRGIVQSLWELVQRRRRLDLEYRLHQVGRLWLIVHGPAAWALLVLMIEHAVMSMWYGGF